MCSFSYCLFWEYSFCNVLEMEYCAEYCMEYTSFVQESCLRVLLFRGANKEILNYSNQSPYECAILAGNNAIAEILEGHKDDDVGKALNTVESESSDSWIIQLLLGFYKISTKIFIFWIICWIWQLDNLTFNDWYKEIN